MVALVNDYSCSRDINKYMKKIINPIRYAEYRERGKKR